MLFLKQKFFAFSQKSFKEMYERVSIFADVELHYGIFKRKKKNLGIY